MEVLALSRIVMWDGGSLWLVDALPNRSPAPRRTDPHAHHAIQVTLSLGGWFRLDTPDAHLDGEAAAVGADVSHVFQAEGLIALLFIEPESRAGRAVAKRLLGDAGLVRIPEEVVEGARSRLLAAYQSGDDGALIEAGRDLIARLAGETIAHSPDLRVRKMIAYATAQLGGRVSLADVLPTIGLSPGRLSHLFVQETGLPFRTYLLWLRLRSAVAAIASGASLTEAAHAAGFADSAHFSRTFRRMFGVAPTSLRMT